MSESIEKNGYYIERLSKQNLGALAKLHNAIYKKPHSANYFIRKYDTAYTGVSNVGYVAFNHEHTPVAFYGVIPCFLRYNGQLFLAAQSADSLIHPNYGFKGLFVQLANLTVDLCREEGVSLIFGFPSQTSLHGFLVKLKWQLTEMMDCYTIPIGMLPIEGIVRRLPYINRAYQKYQHNVLKKYIVPQKGIENSVFKDGFAGLNRNAHYLNYRAYDNTHVIKAGKALLWIKIGEGLTIGDMKCCPKDFDEAMDELYKIAFRLGIKQIHFHASHQTELSGLFAERYEIMPSFYVIFKDLGARIPFDKIKFTYADTDTF